MSDHSQHELDDELLSAYLDEELSTEERARVESRLAADPAARQTLEQLRSVSQSVRGLPQAVVGRDLRESVLRRIEAANTEPPESSESSTLPKLTIGRTMRGWIWASLAIAAALLIMVFQSNKEREAELSDIAQRASDSADDSEKLAGGAAEFRAWDGPVAQEEASGVSSLSDSEPTTSNLSEDGAAIATGTTAGSSSVGGEAAVDHLAAAPRSDMPQEIADTTLGAPPAPRQPASAIDEDQLVVVHVRAKRAAIENKTFDRLLASNGIVIDPADRAEKVAAATRDLQERGVDGRVVEQALEQPASDEADVDMVLVEAPKEAIFSCMAVLNQDSTNYLGVAVDDSEVTDEAAAPETSPAKKLATDLGKFSRGVVTRQQKENFARDKAFYYQFETDRGGPYGGQRFVAGGGAVSGVKQEDDQSLVRESSVDQGRARRVQPQAAGNRRDGERAGRDFALAEVESLAQSAKLRDGRYEFKARPGTDSERLQVLFVLSSGDEPAPSPAAENRPE